MDLRTLFKAAWVCTLAATVFSAGLVAKPGDVIDPATAGEKIILKPDAIGTLQFQQKDNNLTGLKWLPNDSGKQCIGVRFTKKAGKKPKSDMVMLTVTNYFPKKISYRAAIRIKGRANFVETSIRGPLLANVPDGFSGYEMWSDPIEEILLFGFTLLN